MLANGFTERQANAAVRKDHRTLIVGLGSTGLSCARLLAREDVSLAVTDTRERPPGLAAMKEELPDVALFLGGYDRAVFEAAEQIVLSPGVSLREPLIEDACARGVPVYGDIELFARRAIAPVIAITGSNGKSTVTTLVGDMLRDAGRVVRVGGNLGIPALELLGDEEPDFYVLELSSFQLETTWSLDATAAVILNITPDHMDRYKNLAEYVEAKRRVYKGNGVMVINKDDALVMACIEPDRRVARFGVSTPPEHDEFGLIEQDGETYLARGQSALIKLADLRIKGLHNAANALAALALVEAVHIPTESMLTTLRRFEGLPHRTQWVAERNAITWYNDSKGTNVGATLAALKGMPGKVVLIAGGMGKGQDFSPLREAAKEKARAVVLIGEDAKQIEAALGEQVAVIHAASMEQAVIAARDAAQSGDAVLLSPACASFDMFKNYEDRGHEFMEAVKRVLG